MCCSPCFCAPAGFFHSMDREGTGTAVMNLTEVRAQPSGRWGGVGDKVTRHKGERGTWGRW